MRQTTELEEALALAAVEPAAFELLGETIPRMVKSMAASATMTADRFSMPSRETELTALMVLTPSIHR
jgi:hypothetical protein